MERRLLWNLQKRDDVPVELTWDLSLIYTTEEAMLADAQKMKELSLSMEASYKGNLTDAARSTTASTITRRSTV